MASVIKQNDKPLQVKGDLWKRVRKNKTVYLFISPFYILFAIFGLFPVVFSFYLAMQKWDGLSPMQYIGFKNFELVLTDSQFWQSVLNTFIIWIESTIPMLFFALIIAFLLNSAFVKLRSFWRFAFFLPNVTSIVAEAVLFGAFFQTKFGILNWFLGLLGIHPVDWLNQNFWLQIAIAILIIWRYTGYNSIIFLAGLQAISEEIYDAAKIDGASTRQIFFRITIPMVRPIILFTVIMSTIGGMQIFTEPQVLTNSTGGPGHGGLTMALYLYNEAFGSHLFGYGAAIGWFLFLIILAFSVLNSLLVNRIAKS